MVVVAVPVGPCVTGSPLGSPGTMTIRHARHHSESLLERGEGGVHTVIEWSSGSGQPAGPISAAVTLTDQRDPTAPMLTGVTTLSPSLTLQGRAGPYALQVRSIGAIGLRTTLELRAGFLDTIVIRLQTLRVTEGRVCIDTRGA
jgi:hypothetical protein